MPASNQTSAKEYLELVKPKKTSKYRNVWTPYNGRNYQSKDEAHRAAELDILLKAGEIPYWKPQVKYQLGEDCVYRVDFEVGHYDGSKHVEDVKGYLKPEDKRHIRLWKKYGICPLHIRFKDRTEIVEGKS